MPDLTVRTFVESDRDALIEVAARAGEGSPGMELWGHQESANAVYLTPYADLLPDSLHLAFLDRVLVGYLAGCPDPSLLPSEEERMAKAFKDYKVFRMRSARRFFLRAARDTAADRLRRRPSAGELDDPRWPAHLHIDLVPEARGTGAAYVLMERWQEQLDDLGVPGCYLQTLVENTRAVRFFERCGFIAHGDTPLVAGIRHEGRRLRQLTMVNPGPR